MERRRKLTGARAFAWLYVRGAESSRLTTQRFGVCLYPARHKHAVERPSRRFFDTAQLRCSALGVRALAKQRTTLLPRPNWRKSKN